MGKGHRSGISLSAAKSFAAVNLSQPFANLSSPLSPRRHTRHMEPTKPQKVVLLVLAAFMVASWALIIWIATVVTQTALETLQYIVDLAQYTP